MALVLLVGCGRVSFGYPIVPCDEVVSLDSVLGDNGSCYTRHDGPVDYTRARDACEALGGHVATITSQSEHDDVIGLGLTGPTKIGLHTNGGMTFTWDTREALTLTAWAPGHPMYFSSSDTITLVNADGTWTTSDQMNAGPFVCEIEPWFTFEGHGYRVSWAGGSWLQSKVACENMGGYLAVITSAAELAAIAEVMTTVSDVWIGLSFAGSTPTWVTGEEVDFTAWNPGEPDFGPDACTSVASNLNWADLNCGQSTFAICERE